MRIAPDNIGPQDLPAWVKEAPDRPADALVAYIGD
jgi:hypothetical protein